MKAAHLSDADSRETDESYRASEARTSEIPALWVRMWLFLGISALGLAGEGCLIYSPVDDAIGRLPGEPWSPVPLIVSCGGLICVLAFYLYKRERPGSLPVRFVDFLPGYLAITFLLVMGVKLSGLIFSNAASESLPLELFGEAPASAEPSLLKRFFSLMDGPFALIFGCLTIGNLYVTEYALTRLREVLQKLHELRTERVAARAAKSELEESERELARLDAERQQILRKLEPRAAYEFANELSCVIANARAPTEQYIKAHELRRKLPASVLGTEAETDIDIPKLKECVAALTMDAKVIHASFRGEDKGKIS